MDIDQEIQEIEEIDDALEIFKLPKVREKFTLIEWIVKTSKVLLKKLNGKGQNQIEIWKIPIELNKVI